MKLRRKSYGRFATVVFSFRHSILLRVVCSTFVCVFFPNRWSSTSVIATFPQTDFWRKPSVKAKMAVSFFFITRLFPRKLLQICSVSVKWLNGFLFIRKYSLRTTNFYLGVIPKLGKALWSILSPFLSFNSKIPYWETRHCVWSCCYSDSIQTYLINPSMWLIVCFFAFCDFVCLDFSCNHTVVSLALICSFNRMRKHLKLEEVKSAEVPDDTVKAVAQALKDSALVRVSEDG